MNDAPTHFVDRAHEWLQRDNRTCACWRCGHVQPMNALSEARGTCKPQMSPVAWLPLKQQPSTKAQGSRA